MKFQIYRAKENTLIEDCKKNDKQAQEHVYHLYAGKMYALCCRYVKDRMEAEDVMIMAFTKIFERINQYKGDGSFEGWMKRVMVNESLSHLRRNKNMYVETDIAEADYETSMEGLENKLEAEDLLAMINELPAGYRIVFNLYAIDGYSHKEIGNQLGINENTSKSQLSRARAMLQRQLSELDKALTQKIN